MVTPQPGGAVLLFFLFALSVGCAGGASEGALTEEEKRTLDQKLQQIVRGDTSAAEEGRIGTTESGEGIYAVFIRVSDPEAFRRSTIPVNSWSGNIATARLTVEQLRRAARMEVVESIRLSGQARPHG